MSMDKVNTIRYIYTQDPTDDRGLAWTKYVLDYIVNGEPGPNIESGDTDSVNERKTKMFNREIEEKDNRTVR